MPDPMPSDQTMITTAIGWALGGGGLVALGGGIKWLFDTIVNRRATREEKIEERESGYVKKLEERLAVVEHTVAQQAAELERHRIALALMVADVARHRPNATVLRQVQEILGTAFPLVVPTPPDMTDLAARIE